MSSLKIQIELAGINFLLYLPEQVVCDHGMLPFLHEDDPEPDITVRYTWDSIPLPSDAYKGEDIMQEYHYADGMWYCSVMGGSAGPVNVTRYDSQFTDVTCSMSKIVQGWEPLYLSGALRMLPMKAIFQHFGVLFFHASQIQLENRGVIFTAPSGTGKTTQARLWNTHRGAEILCNDRTLIRGRRSFGYPLDGSSPVCWNGETELGAVVVLEQGQENTVERLNPSRAISALMPQIVLDNWNPDAINQSLSDLMDLVKWCPVYRLCCTADEKAVDCLEQQLIEDGVIQNGKY